MHLDWEAEESLEQFLGQWETVVRPFPRSRIIDRPHLTIRWADISFLLYNVIFIHAPNADEQTLEALLDEALTDLRKQSHPGWITVAFDWLSSAAQERFNEIVQSRNLTTLPIRGMAGNILPLKDPASELTFVRCLGGQSLKDYMDVNCAAYAMPKGAADSVLEELTFWQQAFGFVAYAGDVPVATATAFQVKECIYLFFVATIPDAQRKGYADAVIRHALNAAHEATGITRTVLHATDAGHSLYVRLGYHDSCRLVGLMTFPMNG
jgi:ribosomal protein S18 acetylase RimI-like enzyme